MAIQLAHTEVGTIIGDFEEHFNDGWMVTNPVVVQFQQQGVSLFPILGICEENKIHLTKENLRFGGLFTPKPELRNHYNGQFGTGIQLVTSPGPVTAR